MLLCQQGINVLLVELEDHFVRPMLASWQKMQQQAMLGYTMGQAVIIRGDARALPLNGVDGIISSPPYEGAETARGNKERAGD